MLDNMSDGRLIAGFAPGSGPETFNYDVPSAPSREQFWEAVDLIHRAWTEDGPFAWEGRHYPLRYVNPWPRPTQQPHPPVWIPSSRSTETLVNIAKRGYCYFLSSRSHGSETAKSQAQFAKILEDQGSGALVGADPLHVLATDADLAFARLYESRHHAEDRGLAAAGRAKKGEEFSRLDRDIRLVDGAEGAEVAGHVLQIDASTHRRSSSPRNRLLVLLLQCIIANRRVDTTRRSIDF